MEEVIRQQFVVRKTLPAREVDWQQRASSAARVSVAWHQSVKPGLIVYQVIEHLVAFTFLPEEIMAVQNVSGLLLPPSFEKWLRKTTQLDNAHEDSCQSARVLPPQHNILTMMAIQHCELRSQSIIARYLCKICGPAQNEYSKIDRWGDNVHLYLCSIHISVGGGMIHMLLILLLWC